MTGVPSALMWPALIAAAMLGLSVLTYAVYAWDKAAARAGRRRVPERHLHLLSLLGGWPGAWLAQRRLRHKTRKAGFQVGFWLTVLLHLVMSGVLIRVG